MPACQGSEDATHVGGGMDPAYAGLDGSAADPQSAAEIEHPSSGDAGGPAATMLECYSAHLELLRRLSAASATWTACSKDEDCTWGPSAVYCRDNTVQVGVCPVPIGADHLNAATAWTQTLTAELCPRLPAKCKNIPSCFPRQLKCDYQRCVATELE